ncbi:MAG: NADH-quinone oxidoreductase subunit L [Elusimicrobiota bacterium]|jgi:NADH-quinone oxidoreductase subunit L
MMTQYAALGVVAIPACALLVGNLFFHGRWASRMHLPMILSCLLVSLCSLFLAWEVHSGMPLLDAALRPWISLNGCMDSFGLRIDALSVSVLAMVAVVSTLIHVYASAYMQGDPGYGRFFLYFHFFFLSMVGLLVSNSYLQLYIFWEGVGLSSFLLIGFWRHKESARAAAWKAFLVNRIGDVGFLLAVLLMLRYFGTTRFEVVFRLAGELPPGIAALIAGLLFWGACAKSAQFPLHVWLPDAMEGPTPVSALMHAATMVTAGVFLLARSMPLFAHAPQVMSAMRAIGLLTALAAAIVAATQKDLKRILAYSTISQLGFMVLALGAGNVLAAVFHLITHGFFKALLFLCAGGVIFALHDSLHGATSASVDDAGGLSGRLPILTGAFLIGALSLAGLPPFSGFFSKDLVLESVFSSRPLAVLSLLTAAGSSFYIFRMWLLAFLGDRSLQRGPSSPVHAPGLRMKVPILSLAVLSAAGGMLGAPLAAMLGAPAPSLDLHVSAWALGSALLGFGAAWRACMSRPDFDWDWRKRAGAFERACGRDFGWQDFTDGFARAMKECADVIADAWENRRWDPFTESLADSCVGLGEQACALCRGRVNEYAAWMFLGTLLLIFAWVLRWVSCF